jgi:hypothetical protein
MYQQCYGGQWLTTRPTTQDMLPEPMNATGTPGEYTTAGDGEWDYWSTAITGIVGPISCLIVICLSCSAGSGRSAPGGCVGIMLTIAGLMKIGCVICLGSQFLSSWPGRVVYNYFEERPYVTIDVTLIEYLNANPYMYGWGNLVSAVIIFLIICIIYDMSFALAVLCANDAKYTGVNEYNMEQMKYARNKGRKGQPPKMTTFTSADEIKGIPNA